LTPAWWAYPAGRSAIFVGAAPYGGVRSDIGAAFGARFAASSFGMLVGTLPPGVYDLVVYAHSTVTRAFDNARVVRVTMN
jgi:hypothetical protein